MPVDLKGKPFNLNEEQINWVETTINNMTFDEKIGQLFCVSVYVFTEDTIKYFTKDLKAGSLMIRPFALDGLKDNIRDLQNSSKYPMLISANLENGGSGAIVEGTLYSNPMGCAATGDSINGYRLGKVSCQESAAVGVNWGFAPIVDIDNNYRNPITNIRAFSSKTNEVIEFAKGYIKAAKEEGVATTIKHFPGDGCDERDQHLLVSVNDRSYEEWMNTDGKIYQTLIDDGAPTVMIGHIAQPAVARAIKPKISAADAYLPASQSSTLLTGLLREKLGFNGVVVTDSTQMVGYMQSMPRHKALPLSIENGADMILFNRDVNEDFEYMKQGYKNGLVSETRINEAVTRVLALKASLNLHLKKERETLVPTGNPMDIINRKETKEWTKECADKAVTLVKDNRHLLPLSLKKGKRVYLNVIENFVSNNSEFAKDIKKRLENEGFEVTLREREINFNPMEMLSENPSTEAKNMMAEIAENTNGFVSKYDLAMIFLNMETVSNATVVRVNWKVVFGLGNDIPWYAGEIPLVVVSTANPYHLLDIPMAHTYINAYTGNKETVDAVFDKMMGRSIFKGISPVDAFCGHEDCSL